MLPSDCSGQKPIIIEWEKESKTHIPQILSGMENTKQDFPP